MHKSIYSSAIIIFLPLSSFAEYPCYKAYIKPFEPTCSPSAHYLHYCGPSSFSYHSLPTSFDRSTLIPITTIEQTIIEESTPILDQQSKELNDAHQENLNTLNLPPEELIVEAPPAPDIHVIVDEKPSESSKKSDLLYLIEKEAGNKYPKNVFFDFELPNQEDPSPLNSPSKSLYERK